MDSSNKDVVILTSDSDSSNYDESDLVKVLQKKISKLKKDNMILTQDRARSRLAYQEKINTFQTEIEVMQSMVDICNERVETQEQKLINRQREDKVQVVLSGENARELYDAMMVFSRVLTKLEKVMDKEPSVADQPMENLNGPPLCAQNIPNISDVQAIVSAVHAAKVSLAGTAKQLPAPINNLPAAASVKEGVVGKNFVDTRSVALDRVHDTNKTETGKGIWDMDKDPDSESSDSDNLIPEAWIDFSEKLKQVKAELHVDPRMALNHKTFGPQLQDVVKVQCDRSATYYISKDVVENARQKNESYFRYTIRVLEDFFNWEVSLYCACKFHGSQDRQFESTLAHFPQEALDVMLEHCVAVAKEVFEAEMDDHQLKLNMMRHINDHLESVRRLIGVGPSPPDYVKYRQAKRLALKRKIPY